ATARGRRPALGRRPRDAAAAARAGSHCRGGPGSRRGDAGAGFERGGARPPGMDRPVSRPGQARVAAVPGSGPVRRRPPRRNRALGDALTVAAGARRLVPRAGSRAADPLPWRLRGCRAVLTAGRWETAGGGGRGAVLLLAGRVAARLALSQPDTAVALFAEVVRTGGTGAAAPAAELEWARLLERRQQNADAIQHLEHLILSYPESALIPE